VKHRKHIIFDAIYAKVEKFAEPKMEKILAMDDWDAKQIAIDELFENVHDELKNSDKDGDDYIHIVLGSQPNFPILFEKALEKYLRNVVRNEKVSFQEGGNAGTKGKKHSDGESSDLDEYAIPVFMDLMKVNDPSLDDKGIP
jgi:hypothetical protein